MVKRERKDKIWKMEKKRSDSDQPRKVKRSTRKYVLATIVPIIIVIIIMIYFFFPQLLNLTKI